MTMHRRDFLRDSLLSGLVLHAGWETLAAKDPPASPFLEGNFAPVRQETRVENLEIIGRLPGGLEGMFVRNGPNPQFQPRGRYHWFDGDGMIHGVRLRGGRAEYINRYVRTAGWQEESRAGRAVIGGLLDPPDRTRAILSGSPYKNAANTSLVWYDSRLLALWEGGDPHEIRLPDLHTVGRYNFGRQLNHAFTAHPKIDTRAAEMVFFGYSVRSPFLRYAVADLRGQIVHTTTIDLPRAVMMHDFAITERHTLFLDMPWTASLDRITRGEPMLRWEPNHGARIGVLARRGQGRDIRWFNIENCYVFHTLNAYEAGDDVVLHACRMATLPASLEGVPRMGGDDPPTLHEWRFNLRTGAVRERRLADVICELPRLRDDMMGRQHRFGYAGKAMPGMMFDGLLKFDLQNNVSVVTHAHGEGRFGGEGVFVPLPDAHEEDAGWLLTFVHDQRESRNELVIVDTRDFRAAPVARVRIPTRVPYGFHGTWVPEAQLPAIP